MVSVSNLEAVMNLIACQPQYQVLPEEVQKIWDGEIDPSSEEFLNLLNTRSKEAYEQWNRKYKVSGSDDLGCDGSTGAKKTP